MRNWQVVVRGKNQYLLTQMLFQIRNKGVCDFYDFNRISCLCVGIGKNIWPQQFKYRDYITICGTYLTNDDLFSALEKWKYDLDNEKSLIKQRIAFENFLSSKRAFKRVKIEIIRELKRLLGLIIKIWEK